MRRQALQLAASALEAKLNADHSDYLGPTQPCLCGAAARDVDRRPKVVTTVLDDITVQRAYYYCPACGHGFCPRDEAMGLDGSGLSPGVARMAARVGSMASFQEGALLLQELAGIPVDIKAVERTAKRIGREVAHDEETLVKEMLPPSDVMYAGIDGTGIPMRREELAGRAGKQPDGSAKTREVKECVVWTADHRDAHGNPVRDEGSVSYSAALESSHWNDSRPEETPPFAQRVQRELTRRGFFHAHLQVVIADGAPWIRNLASTIFGSHTDLAERWAQERHQELEASQLDAVLAAIAKFIDVPGDAGKRASKEHEYFQNNRERMDYARFRAMGLSVGSGIVEAGCRVLVGQRCKHSGMFWSEDGANALLALRSAFLSHRFDAFWSRRKAAGHRRAAA